MEGDEVVAEIHIRKEVCEDSDEENRGAEASEFLKEEENDQDEKERHQLEESSETKGKQEEIEEQSSPRGVLEIPVSGSDSENCSVDHSRSFESGKSLAEKGVAGALASTGNSNWKKVFHQIKRGSVRKFPSISLLRGHGYGFGFELPKRMMRKKTGRNRSEVDATACGDIVMPKPSWRNFSYEELKQATDNFSPDKMIGKGGHAEVYKGCLSEGQVVAVKHITREKKKDEEKVGDFLSELGIIAHLDHPNAAKLVGFSADNGLHLVLQFSPHGSLATVLHGSEKCLEWKVRCKVAIGVAEGLQYLHYNCQRCIIHRDITASNILLSEDYEAQISDFGLAKWLPKNWGHHIVSPIEGTFGYMAPEYFMHGIVHEKTDVFAFGVLLLELITGRRAVDSCRQSLVMWAKPHLEKNNIKELVDPRLGCDYNEMEMRRAMFVASVCIHTGPTMRPNMKRVVQLLKGDFETEEMKQRSGGSGTLLLDECDMEDYTCTTYLKDLNRHMELVLE